MESSPNSFGPSILLIIGLIAAGLIFLVMLGTGIWMMLKKSK